jgi:hypothetical protein
MQKRSDINFPVIMKAVIALLVLAVFVHLAAWFMFDYLSARETKLDPKPSPMYQEDQRPPAPQLQVTPTLDLQKFHAAEQNLLSTYDWVDRDKGIVRIPVTLAMKLIVQKRNLVPSGQAQSQPATEDAGSMKQQ